MKIKGKIYVESWFPWSMKSYQEFDRKQIAELE
ncbi:hypothetical protein SAMN05421736_11927 [Evansella caseinilytica]|uniref:Uncharacterized protein n=1 Tax=Evansella caseinilytica TaxID=1503961 RepID=A0A1H3U9P9_9BACI|nr:hypothetical protein SAMN05421736_11927 [Evansella caseinilytica]